MDDVSINVVDVNFEPKMTMATTASTATTTLNKKKRRASASFDAIYPGGPPAGSAAGRLFSHDVPSLEPTSGR
eukprot:16085565-Heterocapsa_arctica.AAC.1